DGAVMRDAQRGAAHRIDRPGIGLERDREVTNRQQIGHAMPLPDRGAEGPESSGPEPSGPPGDVPSARRTCGATASSASASRLAWVAPSIDTARTSPA